MGEDEAVRRVAIEDPNASAFAKLYRLIKRALVARASPILDFVLFMLLTIGLSLAGHTFQNVYETRTLVESVRRGVNGAREVSSRPTGDQLLTVSDIDNAEKFWRFMDTTLSDRLMPVAHYDAGAPPSEAAGSVLSAQNKIVTKIRMRQVRVKAVECNSLHLNPRLDSERATGLRGRQCFTKYDRASLDTGEFQGTAYVAGSVLGVKARSALVNAYDAGGFVQVLSPNATEFRARLAQMKADRWTDQATRAVFLDFTVFNPSADQFVSVRFLFAFAPYGAVTAELTVRSMADRLQHKLATRAVNLGAEFALYALGALNLVREMGRLRATGLAEFCSGIWNLLSLASLMAVGAACYYRVAIVSRAWRDIEGDDATEWALGAAGTMDIVQDWDWLGENNSLIIKLQAVALVTAWGRAFEYMQFFSRRIDDFMTTLVYSKKSLVSYVFILAAMLIAFAIGIHLGFGVEEADFATFNMSLLSLSELLFGNFDARPITSASGLLVSTLIIAFFALLAMLSLSAMLAVVNWGSRQVSEGKVERESNDPEKNLKKRLATLLSETLHHPWLSFIPRSLVLHYVTPKAKLDQQDHEQEERDFQVQEQAQALWDSKQQMRAVCGHVNRLEQAMRLLHTEFNLEFNDALQEWTRDNAWCKIRNAQQEDKFQSILRQLRTGDTEKVGNTLNAWKAQKHLFGGDVEWRDPDGFSLLHLASLAGDPDMVNLLLSHKANADGRNDDGNAPLHLAALAGQLNACRVLVEVGFAKAEIPNNANFCALHMAAYGGHVSVLRYLAEEREMSMLAANEEGLTPLHLTVMQGHQSAAMYMAKNFPLALEARANGGESPLHCAVMTQQPESMVRLLLTAGSKVSTKMYDGNNVYQCSLLQYTPPAVVRLLLTVLKMGDDYHRAFASLDEGASGLTLNLMAQSEMVSEMAELVGAGADLNSVQPGGGTALHVAVKKGKIASVKFLLEAGADVHVRDAEELSVLQLAVIDGNFEMHQLVSEGVDARMLGLDRKNNTLLHLAAASGRSLEIVQDLLRNFRLDATRRNGEGLTPMEIAHKTLAEHDEIYGPDGVRPVAFQHQEIIDFLESRNEDDVELPSEASLLARGDKPVYLYSKKVMRFFEGVGLKDQAKVFAQLLYENEIDFEGILLMTDHQLREMGIKKLGARNRMLNGIQGLRLKQGMGALRVEDDVPDLPGMPMPH